MKNMHVLLLCGGGGSEHEVSLRSANFLEKQLGLLPGIEVTRVDVQSSLPSPAVSAFNAVLTASQQADKAVANARTEAEKLTQTAREDADAGGQRPLQGEHPADLAAFLDDAVHDRPIRRQRMRPRPVVQHDDCRGEWVRSLSRGVEH